MKLVKIKSLEEGSLIDSQTISFDNAVSLFAKQQSGELPALWDFEDEFKKKMKKNDGQAITGTNSENSNATTKAADGQEATGVPAAK
jgi:hypothetical protein